MRISRSGPERRAQGDNATQPVFTVDPLTNPELVAIACRLMARVEAMGLLDDDDAHGSPMYDLGLLRKAVEALEENGLGREQVAASRVAEDPTWALERLNEIVEASPLPQKEWVSMQRIFELKQLAHLLGSSTSAIRRYSSGERKTPDTIAARLHWLTLVVADLAGGYNDFGIRRWFERARVQLEGRSPQEVLGRKWSPDDESVERVRRLASALNAPIAT